MNTKPDRLRSVLACACLVAAMPVFAQTRGDTVVAGAPVASDGGQATITRTEPLAEGADPLNALVAADTVDGLLLSVTIDGAQVRLDSAQPARVPRTQARPRENLQGDTVTVTGLANGTVVARNVVPDTVINASEGQGLVRTPRRQIALVLATERALDTVRVEAPATQAVQSLDVRAAYAPYCRAEPRGRWCPQASPTQRP